MMRLSPAYKIRRLPFFFFNGAHDEFAFLARTTHKKIDFALSRLNDDAGKKTQFFRHCVSSEVIDIGNFYNVSVVGFDNQT